jgi:hypothetical protein
MPKIATAPATNEAIELLKTALDQGRTVMLSLAAPPRVVRPPPMVVICCLAFGMTKSEARVLLTLMEHGTVAREDLHVAMSDGRGVSKIKTIDVVVSRVRQKLEPHGVAIETVWGSGYKINEDDRNKLRRLITDHGAGIAGATHQPQPSLRKKCRSMNRKS